MNRQRQPVARLPRPRAFTLIELLVVVVIILILTGLVVVASTQVHEGMRRSRAQNHLAILSDAIERYTQAWPAWKNPAAGQPPIADRGWPHWAPAAVFPTPAYGTVVGYNDLVYDWQPNRPDDDDAMDTSGAFTGRADIERAGETLAYCLTAASGGGPFIKDQPPDLFHMHDTNDPIGPEFYPRHTSVVGAIGQFRFELLDPWGRFYRYFWVTRNPNTPHGLRAITSASPGGPTDPANDPYYARATGYVIECAGKDGKFGYQWKAGPTTVQQNDASDNILVKP